MKLIHNMTEVKRVGAVIRQEITSTRDVLKSVAGSVGVMRVGFSKFDDVTNAILELEAKANAAAEKHPDAAADFAELSADAARIANAFHSISRKMAPNVASASSQLAPYISDDDQDKKEQIFENLDKQSEIMRNVQATVSAVTWNFAELVELNEEQQGERKAMSENIETSIRNAMSSAQLGDVIRQQAETIDHMLQEMSTFIRDRDITSDIRADVDNLIAEVSQRYVMYSQRRIHTEEVHVGEDSWSENDADLRIELF